MSTTVNVVDEGAATVLVNQQAKAIVIPSVPAAPQVLVEQHQRVVLVTPAQAPTVPTQTVQDTIVLQAPASPTAVVSQRTAVVEVSGGGGGVVEDYPDRAVRGSDPRYLYFGRSQAAVGSEDETAAQWQIYRYDIVTDTYSYADGDTLYNNIWNAGGSPPTYETLTYP
jgi:hypothetical protein